MSLVTQWEHADAIHARATSHILQPAQMHLEEFSQEGPRR
jgi:hypothetical protein